MKSLSILRNNNGAVLVIALLIMAVLSLIGAAATMTSSIEIQISGNQKVGKQAFYAADAGVEHITGILQSLFVEQNAAKIAANQAPDWDFALLGRDGTSPATDTNYAGGTTWISNANLGNDKSYSVRVWNNSDAGDTTNDDDRLIYARSDGSGPVGSSSSIEVVLEGGVTGQDTITGYTAQAGAGAGKNYNANDLNAIGAGDLATTQLSTTGI